MFYLNNVFITQNVTIYAKFLKKII